MQFNKYSLKLLLPAMLVLFAGLFYWYEYRPSEIRKTCSEKVSEKNAHYGQLYSACVRSMGLND